MQFPVPQFTDVEDKIFGPLTFNQFRILFGTGVIIILGYSSTKSLLVMFFLLVLFGIPALALAFAKINGRPVYNTISYYVKFLTSPKILVFHKEASNPRTAKNLRDAEVSSAVKISVQAAAPQDTQANLRQVQELLRKTSTAERDIAGKLK